MGQQTQLAESNTDMGLIQDSATSTSGPAEKVLEGVGESPKQI